MNRFLFFILLGGCQSETAALLESWEGIYRVSSIVESIEGCDLPEAQPLDPPFVEIVAAKGVDAHLIDLRRCADERVCEGAGWFTGIAPVLREQRIEASFDDFAFLPSVAGGQCGLTHEDYLFTRTNRNTLRFELRYIGRNDESVSDEEACVDLLESLADDPNECDRTLVLDAKRVQ